jgi:hypothetical protein
MNRKGWIIAAILLFTALISVGFVAQGKSPFVVIFLGLFASFLVYALWPFPPKHKNFSWSDYQKALSRCVGGLPELPLPGRGKRIKKKK